MWPRTKRSALLAFSSSLLFGRIRTGRRSVRKDVSHDCVGENAVGHLTETLPVRSRDVQPSTVHRDRAIRDVDNAARVLKTHPRGDSEQIARERAAVE